MSKNSFKEWSGTTINALICAGALMGIGFSQPAHAAEPFIGQIDTFGFNFPPRGWAHCDGQLLAISQNNALFALLGTTYGGDGRTTFGLPDLRGRTAIHPGTGPGLPTVTWGQRGGAASRVITVANLPAHNHAASAAVHATNTRGNSADPTGHIHASKPRTNIYSDAAPDVTMSPSAITVTTANTGGGQALDIRDPFLGVHHSIALVGLFPSRN